MANPELLKEVGQHFAFGRNWASYSELIDEDRIREAEAGLTRLLGEGALAGRSFLDIGCGSGIHSLAALRLGAASVLATDIDRDSVATTRRTLERFAPSPRWDCREVSVFDLDPEREGRFDVVYSWGVLHHTGAMDEAVARASRLVAPGGLLCVALYGRTPYCGFWRAEKRFYSRAPRAVQWGLRRLFMAAKRASLARRPGGYERMVADYVKQRGMSWEHDAHDWLGGYPYESISPARAHALAAGLGLAPVREFVNRYGVLGSGCDEYVFRRAGPAPS